MEPATIESAPARGWPLSTTALQTVPHLGVGGMGLYFTDLECSFPAVLLRQRSVEALKLNTARGYLHTTVAIGHVRSEDRIELDADLRIREAISVVFSRFAQAGSMRQVLLWLSSSNGSIPLKESICDEFSRMCS